MSTCEVADCARPAKARSLCGLHYERLRRWGNPLRKPTPPVPTREAILAECHEALREAALPGTHPCPACRAESVYVARGDRFYHYDGSDNRECWWAISSGQIEKERQA